MTRQTNSQFEQHYFEQFRRDYPLPDGDIEYIDKPDVIVRGALSLGIEITNLYIAPGSNPASEQVQRHGREQILKQAQAAYLKAGGKKIELSVDFNPGKPIQEIESIAKHLSALAFQIASAPTGPVSPELFKHIEPLRFVYLNANEYPGANWRLVQRFSVSDLSVERLREVVEEKSAKLSAYQPCNRYWLLVVIDFMDRAQDQNLEWPAGTTLGMSQYEKVLLYKPQYRQVLEVPQ